MPGILRQALFFLTFRLRLRQSLAGLADEERDVVAVVDIGDIEVVLGAVVGRTHIDDAK